LPDRDWLISQLADTASPGSVELLAGRPAAPVADRGTIICACFDVGLRTIVEAIGNQRLIDVEAVGLTLSAGTNCGSCRPAIQRLIGENKDAAQR
jgi:assimilatory nitrate reductase catalytic subunit